MQKTAYEMRISDWSSDVCSADLDDVAHQPWHDAGDRVADARAQLGTVEVRGADRTRQAAVEVGAGLRQLRVGRVLIETEPLGDLAQRGEGDVGRVLADLRGQRHHRPRLEPVVDRKSGV